MARTLIICPTFDHVDTLFASIASVQAQRDRDWEMVVICDGAPDRTSEILSAIAATDPRVTYRVFPKGERLGEAYRDGIMRGSNAEFVCHLGDDDLWCDRHIGKMTDMLQHADFALQGTLELGSGGTWTWGFANSGTDIARAAAQRPERRMMIAGLNNFAVRRDAYLALERGWSPAPKGVGSDVYMCTEYLRDARMRIASSAETTFAKLPSRLDRKSFTPERRLVELTPVLAQINVPGYLEQARNVAVIGIPIIRAMYFSGAASAETLDDAMAMIGVEIGSDGDAPTTSVNGAPMTVPLAQSHRDQCEMAWCLLQLAASGAGLARIREVATAGLGFLLTPYLETIDEYDRAGAVSAADLMMREPDLAEIGTAFKVRALILMDELAQARALMTTAAAHWPGAGWLDVMNAWHADRTAKG